MPYTNQDYAVTLPNQANPSQVLQQGIQLRERQQERADSLAERQRQFDERENDRQLANQYKNADIISEGTDLSKHLTGDTIANDIATQKLAQAMPQFVALAKSGTSPVDLQMAISKWKNNVVPALDNIKREFQLGDEAAKKMKELYPELNTEALLTDFRKDIHNRTIDPNGELVAAHLVTPSTFQQNLTNPDFLSNYVQGNKNLVEAITNPKGAETSSALVGNADSHVKYDAKIPFWKTPNYSPTQAVGGYLPSNVVPQLKIKGSELPMDKINNDGKPFNIIDEEVYNRFAQDPKSNLELISATKRVYPQYDKFNQTEKDYIKRHILYNQINALDQSEFHPTGGTKAPRTSITNQAAKTKEAPELKDVIGEIDAAADGRNKGNAYPISGLSPTAKDIVLNYARNAYGKVISTDSNGKEDKRDLDQSDIALVKQNGKNAIVLASNGNLITYLGDYDVQNKVAKTAKERAVVPKGTPKVTVKSIKELKGSLD